MHQKCTSQCGLDDGWSTHRLCGAVTLCYQVLFFLRMIRAPKVEHSATYVVVVVGFWWLLVAVFVSAASTPHLSANSKQGAPFQNSRRQKRKYSLEAYVQKELDSKVDKKPDTGKSDLALDQQIRIWGSLQNVGFLLAGLSMPLLNIPAIIGNPINYWYSVYNMCRYAQGCSKMVSQSKTLSLSKIRVRTTRCCLSLAGSYYSCGWYQYNVRTDTAACCCTCSLHQ